MPTGCTREQMPIGNMIDVQLLATDDPNEQGQPLELFITSLPTKGTVHGPHMHTCHGNPSAALPPTHA